MTEFNNPEPTKEQMDDFRNYAVNYLEIAPETASQHISYTKDGDSFKPVFSDPLPASITADQMADLLLYFENL